MIVCKRIVYALGLIFTLSAAFSAQKQSHGEVVVPKAYKAPVIEAAADLQNVLNNAVSEVVAAKGLKPEEVAATLIDLRDPVKFEMAEVRGGQRIYPASVVKLFYLAALQRQLEDGKVTMTPELTRGVRDMIVDSSNEATQYILDVITETSSGAELPPKQFDIWQAKRNRVNRFYAAMGYTNINVNQKTFCEDAYGIEQQSRNYKSENRNALTTNAVARLLAEIVTGRMNTPERTTQMMALLSRDWSKPSTDTDNQAVGFTGKLLIDRKMNGTKLWSKAGWTSKARHDAAYIETPDGLKYVLVIFTENHANDRDIIPTIAGKVLDGLRGMKK
ncbi:MAG TPA: serine hydrolase [Pyrinomonadaceae bacterium]|nr:serine hydrolase [Pyrinomonadaceae bacterium]